MPRTTPDGYSGCETSSKSPLVRPPPGGLPDRRYLWLPGLALSALVLAYVGEQIPKSASGGLAFLRWLLTALMANLAAGFLGAAATLYFIDRKLEAFRTDERRRLSAVALQDLFGPLEHVVHLALDMLKAASPPDEWPRAVAVLGGPVTATLDEPTSAVVDRLDVLALSPYARGLGPEPWASYLPVRSGTIRDELAAFLERFGHALPVETVELVAAVRHDEYLEFFSQLREIADGTPDGHKVVLWGYADARIRFFDRLTALVRAYEEGSRRYLLVTPLLRSAQHPPAPGSARLDSQFWKSPEERRQLAQEFARKLAKRGEAAESALRPIVRISSVLPGAPDDDGDAGSQGSGTPS